MTSQLPAITEFTEDESLQHLGSATFGRLAFQIAGRVEVFPINYRLDGRRLVFRTAPGTKLVGTVIAGEVAFQVDEVGEQLAWSVLVHGPARVLDTQAEIEQASQLSLRPWVPTVKREYVEISIAEIAGRAYRLGPEPQPEPETIA